MALYKDLLTLISERDGMTREEVEQWLRARLPDASREEIRNARKALHWANMIILSIRGPDTDKYVLTDYGRESLMLEGRAFQRALKKFS